MRILSVTQSYAPFYEFGGPPVKVEALANGLAQRGHGVTVLTADLGFEARQERMPAGSKARRSGGRAKRMEWRVCTCQPGFATGRRAGIRR